MSEAVLLWLFGGAYGLIGVLFVLHQRNRSDMNVLKIAMAGISSDIRHIREIVDNTDDTVNEGLKEIRRNVNQVNTTVQNVCTEVGALKQIVGMLTKDHV